MVLDPPWQAPGNSYDLISSSNAEMNIEVTDSDHVQTLGLSLHCCCCDTIGDKSNWREKWQSHSSSIESLVAKSSWWQWLQRTGRISSPVNNKNCKWMACMWVFRLLSPFGAVQTLRPNQWPCPWLKESFFFPTPVKISKTTPNRSAQKLAS